MAAANNGHIETVDILLIKGANPDKQDKVSYISSCERYHNKLIWQSGWSALMAAVFNFYDDVALRILRAGAAPHIQDNVEFYMSYLPC